MTKQKIENAVVTQGQQVVKILVSTQEHLITGKLRLPIPSVVENPTTKNLLFYALNCGNMFIALEDCIVTSKTDVEYLPERISYYNINLNIVHSCRILEN